MSSGMALPTLTPGSPVSLHLGLCLDPDAGSLTPQPVQMRTHSLWPPGWQGHWQDRLEWARWQGAYWVTTFPGWNPSLSLDIQLYLGLPHILRVTSSH